MEQFAHVCVLSEISRVLTARGKRVLAFNGFDLNPGSVDIIALHNMNEHLFTAAAKSNKRCVKYPEWATVVISYVGDHFNNDDT